ncbi:hypothetical protein ABZ634_22600, partial [Nocardiopsis alba]
MTSSGTRDRVAGGRRAVRSVRRLFEPPSYLRGGRVLWASAGLSLVFGLLMLPYAFVVIGDLAPDRRAWAQGIGGHVREHAATANVRRRRPRCRSVLLRPAVHGA